MLVKDKIDKNFLYYFDQGKATKLYEVMGSHLVKDEDGKYVACEFVLYAPNAKRVSLMGSWNNYAKDKDYLEKIDDYGIWYIKIDKNLEYAKYKYVIDTGYELLYKSDPYAFCQGLRPNKDSVVYDIEGYVWEDKDYMYSHPKTYDMPMLIYELHFGSWKRLGLGENEVYSYKELADLLIPYLKANNYTHVELMPIYEHPLDASWGYQGTGYYSATSRYGQAKDLMYFVDQCHLNSIGVIFDWVPGHICKDSNGLYRFDGSYVYEYPNEQDRENYEWGTANLDLGKGTTRSFLYSNALFFMEYFHVDGFRVDAVSNIIYYLGNKNRGENKGATEFLRGLSRNIFAKDDRVLLIAEDSSDFGGVTLPSDMGGLGFNYKWDMGWMNDTLKYFKLDPIYRKYHHNLLTFSMLYFYNEQFILPFSHDEVVHMKGSLLNKMPGDYWQKFANFRLLMGYMMTHPGKKLSFMGNELAPFSEWAFYKELDWNLLDYDSHKGANKYIQDLNKLYVKEKALYELDYNPSGFKWIDANNQNQSIFIYTRYAKDFKNHLVVVLNCTPNTYHYYRIGVPGTNNYKELINSDDTKYYGSGQVNSKDIKVSPVPCHNFDQSVEITVPPLGMVILKMKRPSKSK